MAVGLQVGARAVYAVVFRHQGAEAVLLGAAVEPFSEAGERVQALRRVWQALQVSSYRSCVVVTSISGTGGVVRFITLPAMTPAELKRAIPFEAKKYVPYQSHEVVLDFQPLGPPKEGKQDVLLVAAKSELVEQHVALLQEAGVIPQAVDFDAFALANAWEATEGSAAGSDVTALLGVWPQRSILNVLVGTQLRMTREFPTGTEGEISEPVAPSVLEYVQEQIRLSLDYFENQYGQGIARLVLGGKGSVWEGFAEHLQEALGHPVKRWDPVEGIPKGPQVDGERLKAIAPDLVIAFGLGVRGVG